MRDKAQKNVWVVMAGLAISMLFLARIEAAGVSLKATFVRGNLPGVAIPNKILNDNEGLYYQDQRGGSNIIFLNNVDGHFEFFVASRGGRYVNLYFDSKVVPPGTGLKDYCGTPYFLTPTPIVPIRTIQWEMRTKNECVLSAGPDADGYYDLTIKDNILNILTMGENQEAIAYLQPMDFYVADSKLTKRNDSRDWYMLDWEPNYVKVKVVEWDGSRAISWAITPITIKFKHMKGETSGQPVPDYYLYPEGTIPRWLFSNAIRACFHGIWNLPYELRITRLQ
jgi:hypothetical protein